jgi:hypothetical protein
VHLLPYLPPVSVTAVGGVVDFTGRLSIFKTLAHIPDDGNALFTVAGGCQDLRVNDFVRMTDTTFLKVRRRAIHHIHNLIITGTRLPAG